MVAGILWLAPATGQIEAAVVKAGAGAGAVLNGVTLWLRRAPTVQTRRDLRLPPLVGLPR